jgi:hypothetical protein
MQTFNRSNADPDIELAQRASTDLFHLDMAVSDLWGDFKPLASRKILAENIVHLELLICKLQSLIDTVKKYGQPHDATAGNHRVGDPEPPVAIP